MMAALVLFWIAYLAGPLLVWAAAVLISRRLHRPSNDVDALHCGRCGYDVRGLATGICPECGSDLASVGRVTALQYARRRRGRWAAVGAWLGLSLAGCIVFSWIAWLHYLPRRQVGALTSPLVLFKGSQNVNWPFLLVIHREWDSDESPRPMQGWYAEKVRFDRLTSDAYRSGAGPMPVLNGDSDAGLDWDCLADSWELRAPNLAKQTGRGFPPLAIVRQWAMDVVARRPPPMPPTQAEMDGLVLAGGDALASFTRGGHTTVQWSKDRLGLILAGATPLTRVVLGGAFRNDIRPMLAPVLVGVALWLTAIIAGWRMLRRHP